MLQTTCNSEIILQNAHIKYITLPQTSFAGGKNTHIKYLVGSTLHVRFDTFLVTWIIWSVYEQVQSCSTIGRGWINIWRLQSEKKIRQC